MRFKEIYEKYINGSASEEEIKIIEEEIEKNEVISEYLSQNIEDDFLNKKDLFGEMRISKEENEFKRKSEKDLLKSINKSIRNKFIVTGICSVLVVIGLVGGAKYIISPAMDSKYYNPTKMLGQFTEQLLVDISVFTELHFPGIDTSYTNSESLGYGRYNTKISQYNTFKNTETTYEGVIDKGQLMYIGSDFYKYPIMNIFKYGVYPYDDYDNDDSSEIEELKLLPKTAQANIYVSFKEDIDMKEIVRLINKYEDLYFSWVGIRTCDKKTQQLPQMGFETSGSGIVLEGFEENEKYPYLELGTLDWDRNDSEVYETHFKSLLKYMIDNKSFTELNHPNVYEDVYKYTLDYVNKNGVKSYGVLVTGDAESILKLREESYVYGISIDDVKISSYSH